MDAIKKILREQAKENCRSDLQKQFFIDRIWQRDYLSHYEATDDCEIDREQALYDYIYHVAGDDELEITLNSLLETWFQEVVKIDRE